MTQSGFTLLEILISFLLLSLMLLGLDALQLGTFKQIKNSYYLSVATQQLNNISERLRTVGENDPNSQIITWNKQNEEVLPQGYGKVAGYFPNYQLTIFWGDQLLQTCEKIKIRQKGCLRMSLTI